MGLSDCRTTGPSDWGILTAEMKRFEYEIGPSGGVSYGAPSGYHDDCVMALALANHGRWETGNCGHMFTLSGPSRRMRRGPRVAIE